MSKNEILYCIQYVHYYCLFDLYIYVPLGRQPGSGLWLRFVTYGHPEGYAAGDITIIWNDVLKWSVGWCASVPTFIYFLLPLPSDGMLSFLGFENLFTIY